MSKDLLPVACHRMRTGMPPTTWAWISGPASLGAIDQAKLYGWEIENAYLPPTDVMTTEFEDWYNEWARQQGLNQCRVPDGRLLSPTASVAENAFLAGCMISAIHYMELCRQEPTP